jgi:hypothetical protein
MMAIRYYTEAEYAEEITHRKTNRTMSRLDKLSWKVAIGFVVWGITYIGLWALAFVYIF